MVKSVRRLIVGASVFATVSAIGSAPAFAASIVNATVGGNASFLTYTVVNGQTVVDPTNNVQAALDGGSSAPGGNVELFSNSETLSNAAFSSYTGTTSLQGTLGGKAITLSSLTLADWNTTLSSGKTLGQQWFGDLLVAHSLSSWVGTPIASNLFNLFTSNKGLQRFSDPNISYVNQDEQTGLIKIGLAGHLNAAPLLGLTGTIQASEVVKVSYNRQTPQYLYNFTATNSGLVSKDGTNSHTGNYEVSLQGELPPKPTPESVPEPSLALGLFSLGGMWAARRKLTKQASV